MSVAPITDPTATKSIRDLFKTTPNPAIARKVALASLVSVLLNSLN